MITITYSISPYANNYELTMEQFIEQNNDTMPYGLISNICKRDLEIIFSYLAPHELLSYLTRAEQFILICLILESTSR